jgi:ribose-phosphate pyrophosphokinase
MPERAKDELEIFTGNSNPALAREVCEYLGVLLGEAEVGRFPDGEVMVEVRENVRGGDCFVLQSICTPPNDNLMELLLMMDALRRASAKRITAVVPYFGYARQDRKVTPRVPISAKLRCGARHVSMARSSSSELMSARRRSPSIWCDESEGLRRLDEGAAGT